MRLFEIVCLDERATLGLGDYAARAFAVEGPGPMLPDNQTSSGSGARVVSVQVGKAAPLGPKHVPSGFVKRGVQGPVEVRSLGLDGDQQADLSVHGGPDKAVYGYALAHYSDWRREFPEHDQILLSGGAFGENLTIEGLTEADLCVGDVHAIGSARLQVCQPRQPCFKFSLRFNDRRMPRAMVESRRSGWYYRVLQVGRIQAGDRVEVVARPHPRLRFPRLVEIVYGSEVEPAELVELSRAEGVAHWIRAMASRALGDPAV
jgi:MOSC domain-containing protein YiiM